MLFIAIAGLIVSWINLNNTVKPYKQNKAKKERD